MEEDSADNPEYKIRVAGIGLYSILFFMTFVIFIRNLCHEKISILSVGKTFYLFLMCFIIVRVSWLAIKAFIIEQNHGEYILGRIALCLFFTSFTLVLFHWAEEFRRRYYDDKRFLPTVFWPFIILNAFVWCGQVVMIVWYTVTQDQIKTKVYNINSIVIAGINLLVSIFFFLYSVRLYYLTRKPSIATVPPTSPFDNSANGIVPPDFLSPGTRNALLKIFIANAIFGVCFLLRVGMWSLKPIFGLEIDNVLYIIFSYFVPELLPSLLQLYVIKIRKDEYRQQDQFIKDLYAESEEEGKEAPFHTSTDRIENEGGGSNGVENIIQFNEPKREKSYEQSPLLNSPHRTQSSPIQFE